MRRLIAANRVVMPDGKEFVPGVVELDGECVESVARLEQELPFTEWLGGTIEIISNSKYLTIKKQ